MSLSWRRALGSAFVASALFALSAAPAAAQVKTGEYRFTPSVNSTIASGIITEIWAKVYYPTFSGTNKYPLIVLLHGQHPTCGKNNSGPPRIDNNDDYMSTGACPTGYSVVKSHEGYAYLANDLASRGYIVVSINSNRGFSESGLANDTGMLRARGRLVLWHLKKLNEWNRNAEATPSGIGASLVNRIDFSQVGLLGHSRGGPGVRSALADFRFGTSPNWKSMIPGMTIRSLIELAPVRPPDSDPEIFTSNDVPYLHIVGLCDGELSSGSGPEVMSPHFDKLLDWGSTEVSTSFKGEYAILGANHRYFNTEWQQNDTLGCKNQPSLLTFAANESGSQSQRDALLTAARAFFVSTVGAGRDPSQMRFMDPAYPAASGPAVVRAYSPSPSGRNSLRLEAFDNPTGINSNWVQNDPSNLASYVHLRGGGSIAEHDNNYPHGDITWTTSGTNTFLQTNWMAPGTGQDLTLYNYLEFRAESGRTPNVDFNIQLVNADGTRSSSVLSSSYVTLPALPATYVVGGSADTPSDFFHLPLRTFRIPLTAFTGANLSSIRGARFVFNRSNSCSTSNPCNVILAGIVASPDTNLARNRPVAVSSVQDNNPGTYGGPKALDNNTGTRWSSAASDPQWIRVDLGYQKQLNSLVLRWEAAYGKDFKIQVSDDASTWTDVHTVTGGTGGTQILRLATPAMGRYVRLYGTKRGTGYGYSLYELEVYGH
jgi:hypothetical protein